MIQLYKIIIALLCFKVVLSFIPSPSQEQNIPVFEPYPTTIITPQSSCSTSLITSVVSFSSDNNNFAAMSIQQCGIWIYQITNLNNPILVFTDSLGSGYTNRISYSNTQQIIWAANANGDFYGINVSSQPFETIIHKSSKNQLVIYRITPWVLNEQIIFLLCNQQVQIFDWRQKNNGVVFLNSLDVHGISAIKIQFFQQNQFSAIGVSNIGVQFYQVNNIQNIDKLQFNYSCVIKPNLFDVRDFVIIGDSLIAIMSLQLQLGFTLYSLQNYLSDPTHTCNSNSFTIQSQFPLQGNGGFLYLTQNQRYIYAQQRVTGVNVYDLSQQSLQIVQQISIGDNCEDITMNSSENLLFYSNSLTLQIFSKTAPNFNRDVPNLLLNTSQMVKYNFFSSASTGSFNSQCIWKDNGQTLILARSTYGVTVLKYSGNGILESNSVVYPIFSQQNAISDIQFLSDQKTAYIARKAEGLSVVDFTDPSNPTILKENIILNPSYVFYNFLKFYDNFQKGFVSNSINVLLFSLADPLNPVLLGIIDTLTFTKGKLQANRMAVNKAENFVFISVNSYGVVVADISNPLNPQPVSQFFTDGVSEIIITSNDQYCIIGTTYQGIYITQINPSGSLSQVQNIRISGTIFRILLIKNEEYILVACYEHPSISVVSIKDINNPQQIQMISNLDPVANYFFCASSEGTQVFLTSQLQIYLLTIQSQIIIHTQMYQLISQQNNSQFNRQVISKDVPLLIGWQVEIHLVPIYQTNTLIFRKAYFYDSFILESLPSWIVFYPSQMILKLQIPKESLSKNSDGEFSNSIQQIVLLAIVHITQSTFVNSYLNITPNDSLNIYNTCYQLGFIDDQGYIQSVYHATNPISFGIFESNLLAKWQSSSQYQLVKNFIQYTLNQNIIYYTILFSIQNSLTVDLKNQTQAIYSIVNSISLTLTVYLKISEGQFVQNNSLVFVNKSYSGVLMLLTDKQDQIQFQGSLANINFLIQNGIKYSIENKNISKNDIFITVLVSDGVNYDYQQQFQFSDLKFLLPQSQIIFSMTNSMQNEINSKYPGGRIYIQESFQYSISSDIFTSADDNELIFSAQIKIGNVFLDIPKSYWLQFSSSDRSFSGIPETNNFNENIIVQVTVTDGYSSVVDSFNIIPNQIPFAYIFQIALQVLGPLFGMIGLYKYRSFMYNLYYKDQYSYSREIIYVGEIYQKQITITENIKPTAINLWQFFLRDFGDKQLTEQFQQEFKSIKNISQLNQTEIKTGGQISSSVQLSNNNSFQNNNLINLEVIKRKNSVRYKIKSSQKFQQQKKLTSKSNQNQEEQNKSIINKQDSKTVEDKPCHTSMNLKQTATFINNTVVSRQEGLENFQGWSKINKIQNIKPLLVQANTEGQGQQQYGNEILNSFNRSKMKSLTKSIKQQILNSVKRDRLLKCEQSLKNIITIFNQNGNINKEKILSYIKQRQLSLPEKARQANQIILNQLDNVNSRVSLAIISFLVEYLMSLEKQTKYIFEALKVIALQSYYEIDWYKAYVIISPCFQTICLNPYSQITLNMNSLDSALQMINNNINNKFLNQDQMKSSNLSYSQTLIKENLRAKALGFSIEKLQFLQVSSGESLHTYQYSVHAVQAYEKNTSIKRCNCLYKSLNLDYQKMSLIENNKLPSWLSNVDLINGVIIFGGVPEEKDIGSIVIKVIDQYGYILRSFELFIEDQHQRQSKDISFKQVFENNKPDYILQPPLNIPKQSSPYLQTLTPLNLNTYILTEQQTYENEKNIPIIDLSSFQNNNQEQLKAMIQKQNQLTIIDIDQQNNKYISNEQNRIKKQIVEQDESHSKVNRLSELNTAKSVKLHYLQQPCQEDDSTFSNYM